MLTVPDKKELCLATSVSSLEKIASRDLRNIPNDKLLKSAQTVYQQASARKATGDEELALVYYLRFQMICSSISRTNEQLIKDTFSREIKFAETFIEGLKTSLTQRYQRLKDELELQVINEEHPDVPEGYEDSRVIKLGPATGSTGSIPLKRESKSPIFKPREKYYPEGFISTSELYFLISKEVDCVIFDIRTSEEFSGSYMKIDHCVNLPDHIIHSGLSAHQLTKSVPNESLDIWEKRNKCDLIVLLDSNSTRITAKASKLAILKHIICDWDQNYAGVEVVFLDGGYLQWWEDYPMFCSTSHGLFNERNTSLAELVDLDSIDYPIADGINYIPDDVTPFSPTFDRSLKPVGKLKSNKVPTNHTNLRERCMEHYSELEQVKEKGMKELQDLRRQNISDEERKMKLQLNFIDLENKRQELKMFQKEYEHALVDEQFNLDNKKEATDIEEHSMGDTEIVKQKLLEEVREKKKPSTDVKSIESKKEIQKRTPPKPPMKFEYIKTADLRRLLVEDRLIPVPKRILPFQPPEIDRTKKPRKGYIPGVTGLRNLGNTCFMNSIIQFLSNTKSVAQYFINNEHLQDLSGTSTNIQNNGFTKHLGDTILALWSPDTKDPFAPSKLKRITYSNIPTFVQGYHQDAHEFYIKILEFLHEETRKDIIVNRHTILTPMQEAWITQAFGKCSKLNDMFLGMLRCTMKCIECNSTRDKYESFINVTLDLPQNSDECYLKNCLKTYLDPQPIQGFKCMKCNCESVCQQFAFATYPKYVVITLSRFKLFDEQLGNYTKNHILVNYPLELDMPLFTYKLYAVILHFGEMTGGHYISICRNPNNKNWYKFNDETVDLVPEETAINPHDVYILCYEMKN